jgi:hypothetical protein
MRTGSYADQAPTWSGGTLRIPRRAGLGQSPRTILEELQRIQSTDIVLPTDDGRDLRLRCVVRPDAAQAALLDRLGLELPERLRIRPPLLDPAQM